MADKTALNTAITEAEAYYNSISESNPDAAAALLAAINAAKTVQGNADATQSEIETAAQTLTDALNLCACEGQAQPFNPLCSRSTQSRHTTVHNPHNRG